MATCRLSVEIKSRWWLPVYIRTLTQFCVMMRCEPDYRKVAEFIVKHGISQNVNSEPVKR
ncbi:hypothetical protein B9024_015485 [Enterobacter hormaechei subsp. xiangfangensis]|nr:hypothetical protein B9024_015485 [Enterobacter hormaechei subsp. xiangfangensis]RNU01665.1 hypothetical protein B9061_017470 [Enterobacter hormaechei subsp. xiangfangensis]RNU82532.1 hypothetical protein B9010_014755 [Enterobacter hormaechei subsp. xiangfangensis]ROC78072.1 hypothetical protein C4Z24_020150 [Enterobacter hormaechei subsp. xiangfangensis]ROC93810.1 hypothetical protein C4Z22_008120 [Enterobacter hormaechei subsp. xiangfangensis]